MSGQILINAVGAFAALCSMASFIPQAVKIIRERDASSVSLGMYVVTVIGFALWSTYGVMLGSWPLIGSNLVSLALSALILFLKLRYPDGPSGSKPSPNPLAA
jgi:MtN3 and saliva related transmembrane protein